MMSKLHYKMYKSGKQWCYVALATVSAVVGLATANITAFADTNDTQSTSVTTVSIQPAGNQTSANSDAGTLVASTNSTSKGAVTVTAKATNGNEQNKSTAVEENADVTPRANYSLAAKAAKDNDQTDEKLNGVHLTNGNYYYYKNGVKQTNYYYTDSQNNQTYYFGNDGVRWNNRFMNAWGSTYYFGNDGARWDNRFMVKWGNAYYFTNDGSLMKNQTRNVKGVRYTANHDGVIALRNQFLNANENQLFYFDSNGHLTVNKFYHNWGNTYYFGNDGARYTNQFLNKDGKTYYFDNQGIMYRDQYYKNWGHTYYFGQNGARYTNQFLNKNGKVYYFDDQGIMAQNQYYKNWGHTYYFGQDGARYTNQFLNKNGKVYYFDGQGVMYQNQWYRNWGNGYYFKADGARATNEIVKVGNDYYYFNDQGAMKTNYFLTKDGHTYYFDQDGKEYRNKFYTNWGQTYYFGDDGARWDNKWMDAWGHHYYFKANGARATNETLSINGFDVTFDKDGIATKGYVFDSIRNYVANQIADTLRQQRNANVLYDWTSQDHNYQELAAHDMAQLIAQGDVNNDPVVIASLLQKNDLLQGKVISTKVVNLASQSATIDNFVNDFVNSINKSVDVNNSIVGVGYDSKNNKLAALLFKPEKVTTPSKVSSDLQANISKVYPASNSKVTVKYPLTVNTTLPMNAVVGGLNQFSSSLLSGKQNTPISEDVLKTIFAGLGGNATALDGTQTYYAANGDPYHYEFWLDGKNADEKLNNFLALNHEVKYGDPIKVNYTATLTWGGC